jgi:ribosomal protein L2
MKVAAPRKAHAPLCPATTGAMRAVDHPHGEGVRRDFSRLHPGRTGAGSFEYAHVLSHMSEMGGAGISAL